MKILIPIAGHSRRFQEAGFELPKAFISVGGKPMIQHVVEMFSPADEFFFVVNREQATKFPDWVEYLKSLAAKTHVTVITSHEKGPVYSCLQVNGIADDESFILNYCDFDMEWDYAAFLRCARFSDGALAVFRGFQPASLGETLFAYVRAEGDKLIELQEKKSFTQDRTSEFASTGTYYFRKFSTFKKYAAEVMVDCPLPEAYASLIYNPMVRDGLNVRIFPVDKFICLGTPEDVSQYQLWFKNIAPKNTEIKSTARKQTANGFKNRSPRPLVNIVLMAGEGSRFRSEGFTQRKPFIPVEGLPMVLATVKSLLPSDEWILVIRDREPLSESFLLKFRSITGVEPIVVTVPANTTGPAESCWYAKGYIDPHASVLVSSCDYAVGFDAASFEKRSVEAEVLIWTTSLKGRIVRSVEDYAYCDSPDGRTVSSLKEKCTISAHPETDPLVLGTFWYRRASDLFASIDAGRTHNLRVNGELYVGTCINQLIDAGRKVEMFCVDRWISFGTPVELHTYHYWRSFFEGRNLKTQSE